MPPRFALFYAAAADISFLRRGAFSRLRCHTFGAFRRFHAARRLRCRRRRHASSILRMRHAADMRRFSFHTHATLFFYAAALRRAFAALARFSRRRRRRC